MSLISWKKSCISLFVAIIILAVVLSAQGGAAHSPLFPRDNDTLAKAVIVNEPAKSWAIYSQLTSGQAQYFRIEMKLGERIYVSALTAHDPGKEGLMPSFALMGPGLPRNDPLPSYVERPMGSESGVMRFNGSAPSEGTFEPFTPGAYFTVSEADLNATATGTFYIAVFADGGGSYGLTIGYMELFSLDEIVLLPINIVRVYQWEGQPLQLALSPLFLTLVLGGSLLFLQLRREGKAIKGRQTWAAISGLVFLGTAASISYQSALALTMVPYSGEVWLAVGFIVASLVFAIRMLWFALRGKGVASWGTRVAFVAIGLLGLGLWSGYYIGPLLALILGLAPNRWMRRNEKAIA